MDIQHVRGKCLTSRPPGHSWPSRQLSSHSVGTPLGSTYDIVRTMMLKGVLQFEREPSD